MGLGPLLAAALAGCQGDDSTLPLPPDAFSDAHSDATASRDGGAEAAIDAGSPDVATAALHSVDATHVAVEAEGDAPAPDAGDGSDAPTE